MPPRLPPKRTTTTPPARKRTFNITRGDNEKRGEKILLYADTGMGKTSLAILAPDDPVFIPLDEGVGKLVHPITGEKPNRVEGVTTFQDVKDVLSAIETFKDGGTIVIDTVTMLEDLATDHIISTIPTEKGAKVTNIEGYGWNKGYRHLYDAMKSILPLCDRLVHQGKNVILIAQAIPNRISNPGGDDYLRDGPRLYAGKPSIEALYCEWADHILRIDYQDVWVKKANKEARSGKVTGETTRVIYTQPELYFRAKSRTLNKPVISFEDKADDSLWKFMFGTKND